MSMWNGTIALDAMELLTLLDSCKVKLLHPLFLFFIFHVLPFLSSYSSSLVLPRPVCVLHVTNC